MKKARFHPWVMLAALVPAFALAEPATTETKTVHCLPLNQIRQMTIVDDKNLVFEMPNHKYYQNTLRHTCGGLARNGTIMYSVTQNQLCDLDIITVLDPIGNGFIAGPSCGLGQFKQIPEAQAKALIKKH